MGQSPILKGDFDVSNHFKRRSFRKFILSFSITLIVIVAVAGGAYAALRMSVRPPEIEEFVEVVRPLPRPPVVNNPVLPPATNISDEGNDDEPSDEPYPGYETLIFQRRPNFYTFLIYGLDSGVNVDTIMVAAFDAEAGKAYLISLPRDTRVDADRRVGLRKLSASYAFGQAQGRGHEGGIYRLKNEVSTLIGFRPDFYVGIDERAFIRLINGIGGVEVTIPFHMRYDDPYQNLHINLPAGQRVLTGQQAMHFARFRLANEGYRGVTDFQRVAHQQQIISAAVQELLSPRTITLIPELVRIYREHVRTDLSPLEIAWFVEQVPGLNANLLSTYTLPMARTVRQGWYEIPDQDEVLELVNRTINPFMQEITAEMLRIVE